MAATYTQPTRTPIWAATSLNIIEPPTAKKNEGWLFEEIPPSAFENDRTKLIGDWFNWINERFSDGADQDELLLKVPDNGNDGLLLANDGTNDYAEFFGDTKFRLEKISGNPTLTVQDDSLGSFTGDAKVEWDRTNNRWEFYTSGTPNTSILRVVENGLEIRSGQSGIGGGLVVGGAQPVTDGYIYLGGDATAQAFSLQRVDANEVRMNFHGANVDFLAYDRTTDEMQLFISNTEKFAAGDGYLRLGDTGFRMSYVSSTDVRLQFDSNDYIGYDRTNNEHDFVIGSSTTFQVTATGARIPFSTAPGSPVDGDVNALSTSGLLSNYSKHGWTNLAGKVYALTTPASRTTSGQFTSHNIPANTLRVGSTIRVHAGFYVQTATGAQIRFQVEVGGTGVVFSTTRTAAVGETCVIDIVATVASIGASGISRWSGQSAYAQTLTDGDITCNIGVVTKDTTAAIAISPAVNFVSSTDTVQLRTFTVDISD